MEFELELTEAAAARLPRLRAILARKQGRAQSRAVRWVWHDGADAELARNGLALVEGRGAWRLERSRPLRRDEVRRDPARDDAWPPGAVAPVLAEAASVAALAEEAGVDVPGHLVPWAAFEGRALTMSLRPARDLEAAVVTEAGAELSEPAEPPEPAGGGLELTLLTGTIRTVARENPQWRLRLSGPGDEVGDLAIWLAGEIDARVPASSLAERALAAARGYDPAPRRLGAPVLAATMSVAGAFADVVGHLTDVVLHHAPAAAAAASGPEPVHQMRVATRRLRSAIAVFSRAIATAEVELADAGLKHLASTLGPARDWDVFTTGTGADVHAAFAGDEAVERLLDEAERQRLAGYDALRQFVASPEFRQLGVRLALLANAPVRPVADEAAAELPESLAEFAARALRRRLKRMFVEGSDIEHLDTTTLHDIRLRAKRLRYACEFFAPVFPHKTTRRFIHRLSVLQERLGILNDGTVAADLLARLERSGRRAGSSAVSRALAVGTVRGFVAAHGGAVRAGISDAWRKFHKTPLFWE